TTNPSRTKPWACDSSSSPIGCSTCCSATASTRRPRLPKRLTCTASLKRASSDSSLTSSSRCQLVHKGTTTSGAPLMLSNWQRGGPLLTVSSTSPNTALSANTEPKVT